jgi:hypothetical protein
MWINYGYLDFNYIYQDIRNVLGKRRRACIGKVQGLPLR